MTCDSPPVRVCSVLKDSKNSPSMGTHKSLGLCLRLEMICRHRTCLSLAWQSYMALICAHCPPSPGLVLGLVHAWLLASLSLVFNASFPDLNHRLFNANTCHSLWLCDLVLVPTAPFPQQLSRWLFQIPADAQSLLTLVETFAHPEAAAPLCRALLSDVLTVSSPGRRSCLCKTGHRLSAGRL